MKKTRPIRPWCTAAIALVAALALGACADDLAQRPEPTPEDLLSRYASEPLSAEFCLLVDLVCSKPEHQGKAACVKLVDACKPLSLADGGAPGPGALDGASASPPPDLPPQQSGPPDLVVSAVSWQPKSPQAGDAVTFSATIKNQGGAATPQGTILGVRFTVDGVIASWSDHETSALGPGKSVTVTANGGPAGKSTWSASQGTVSVEAWVDDIDRIPNEADEGNNKLTVQLQVAGSGTPGTTPPKTGVCAASAAPPPQAAAEGLTHLAFCDDFSTSSIAAGATPAARDIVGDKKWTTELGFGNNSNVMTAKSLKWNGDGTVTIDPDWEKYQWYMTSVALRGGKMHGYFIDRKKRWYAEVRWRFDKKGGGQPAFWSMDTCHTYKWPGKCTQHGGKYIEPDFWEYFNAVTSTHYYQQGPNGEQIKLTRCNKTVSGQGVSAGQWFTTGHMYTSNPAKQRYYKNDKLIYTRTTSTGGCKDFGGGSTADFIAEMADGRYPIYLGSKYGDVITYDYVRVWEHPSDQ